MSSKGQQVLTLRLGSRTMQTIFIVAEMSNEAILGAPFLRENNLMVDVGGGRLLQSTARGDADQVRRVVCARPAVVEGRHEAIIEGRIVGEWPPAQEGLIEGGVEKQGSGGFLVGRGLVMPQGGSTWVRVLNPGTEAVILYRDMTIASIQEVVAAGDAVQGGTTSTDKGEVASCRVASLDARVQKGVIDGLVEGTESHRRRQLADLLRSKFQAFQSNKEDKGHTTLAEHAINTGDARPIKQPPRRMAPHRRDMVESELEKMLQAGVIEPSQGPWASPVVLVRKKDGTNRFCVDYRRLNGVTVKDAYPLPRVEDCLDTMAGAAWFSSMDLASGYWQLDVKEEDREKTAFTTHKGLFQFTRMPFGLCNAPGTFERVMEVVVRGLQWRTCLVYLDDIVVYAATYEEHLERLGEVLDRLISAGLKIKPSKCQLARRRVMFLGHLVSEEGIGTVLANSDHGDGG